MPRLAQGKSFEEQIDILANAGFNTVAYNHAMAEITHDRILEERETARLVRNTFWLAVASAMASAVSTFVAVVGIFLHK